MSTEATIVAPEAPATDTEATVAVEQAPEVTDVTARDGRQMLMISRAEFHRMVETRAQARAAAEAQRERADKADARASNWQMAFCYTVLAFAVVIAVIAEVLR